ncbi:MAG TPA: homocysteine S-methyltransferase family protein [Beijerinckiaceae bacterium]|jgi:S-methylmethionine-dependent homocysteine/selenocysteine methylase
MTSAELPKAHGRPYITDGGLETTLVFHERVDLPFFAAFPLVLSQEGRALLERYFEPYFALASAHEAGFVLDTPTWRANPDWAERLGLSADDLRTANLKAAAVIRDLRARRMPGRPVVLNGVLGPRGDGYVVGQAMSVPEAAAYHCPQMQALRDGGVDMASAVTMTSADEAAGIVLAARDCGLPVAVSFTVETDGRLPSGESLEQAIARTERATGAYPAYYMINCAHPDHFADTLETAGPWRERLGGVRANASRRSHAELDAATELDPGDPSELGRDYRRLRAKLPGLCVLGGCCGTDHRHLAAICEACF